MRGNGASRAYSGLKEALMDNDFHTMLPPRHLPLEISTPASPRCIAQSANTKAALVLGYNHPDYVVRTMESGPPLVIAGDEDGGVSVRQVPAHATGEGADAKSWSMGLGEPRRARLHDAGVNRYRAYRDRPDPRFHTGKSHY